MKQIGIREHGTPVRDFVCRYAVQIGFLGLTVLGLLIRLSMYDAVTGDYSWFLCNWINELSKYPGISGIGQNIGEYNVPYMLFLAVVGKTPANNLYEIKALSVLADFVCAFFAVKIVAAVRGTKAFTVQNLFVYAAVMLSPAIFLDSGFWAQCDALYTCLCTICLYEMIRERYNSAMCFFGAALAFKLQAVFLLPAILVYFFATKKMKARSFLFAPLVFLLCDLPAILAGRSVSDTLLIYVKQTGIYKELTKNCPNLFSLMRGDYDLLKNAGIFLALAVLGVGAVVVLRQKRLTPARMLLLSTWCTFALCWFLPGMHERYTFLSCVLVILWAAVFPRDWWIAVGINLVTLLSYSPYLFHTTVVDMTWLSLFNLTFLVFLTIRLFLPETVPADKSGEGVPGVAATGEPAGISACDGETGLPSADAAKPEGTSAVGTAVDATVVGTTDGTPENGTPEGGTLPAAEALPAEDNVCAAAPCGAEKDGVTRGIFCLMYSSGRKRIAVPVKCWSLSFSIPARKKKAKTEKAEKMRRTAGSEHLKED